MKKVIILVILLIVFFINFPPDSSAQVSLDCSGRVIDFYYNDSAPLQGTQVYFYTEGHSQPQNPCFIPGDPYGGQGQPVTASGPDGGWNYICPLWPNRTEWSITRIEYVRHDYQITSSYPCTSGPPCFSCNSSDVYMQPLGTPGRDCTDPYSGQCAFVWDGYYSDQTTCMFHEDCDLTRPQSGPGPFCTNTSGTKGIDTAIGCIPYTNFTEFPSFIVKWAMYFGGGVGILLIIYAGFTIIISSGNPEKVKAGKDLLTAAIAGLALIIFSVFILELFGVRILALPGLN